MTRKPVNVSEYLYTRLRQCGVTSLHGLPGDFNLLALDYVESSGLTWVGNCNELNAGYAADAYARVRGLGAIMTTFGVGELSAVNAIAGSYSEYVPVLHIVGTPNTASQKNGMLLHHTLGNGDFRVFRNMAQHVTIAQANLLDAETAPAEIDRVIQKCFVESRPVYLELPSDIATQSVDGSLLDRPLDLSTPKNDPGAEDRVVSLILEKLYASKHPVILVDAGAHRHRVMEETEALIRKSGLPSFIAPMGKGATNESLPNVIGVYAGDASHPEIREMVDTSDFVLSIGNVQSDLNTASFSYRISRLNSVDLHFDHTIIDYAKYEKLYFKWILKRLGEEIDPSKLPQSAVKIPSLSQITTNGEMAFPPQAITHEYLWPRMSSWLRSGDILITDTGTSFIGMWGVKLPEGVSAMSQILWSSIGYGVPAAQGAALAAKEAGSGQRTICFEGDGSFQVTAQELSTIIKHDLDVTMFVIENDGYTIERWVHGMDASYNDILQWRYSKFPEAFLPECEVGKRSVKTWKIATKDQLEDLLEDAEFQRGKGLQFVELHMPRYDAPKTLRDFGQKAAKRNA